MDPYSLSHALCQFAFFSRAVAWGLHTSLAAFGWRKGSCRRRLTNPLKLLAVHFAFRPSVESRRNHALLHNPPRCSMSTRHVKPPERCLHVDRLARSVFAYKTSSEARFCVIEGCAPRWELRGELRARQSGRASWLCEMRAAGCGSAGMRAVGMRARYVRDSPYIERGSPCGA